MPPDRFDQRQAISDDTRAPVAFEPRVEAPALVAGAGVRLLGGAQALLAERRRRGRRRQLAEGAASDRVHHRQAGTPLGAGRPLPYPGGRGCVRAGGIADGLALAGPALAAIAGALVIGRVATGPRAGHQVLRLGADDTAPVVSSAGPRHAYREGVDLHANVAVRAGERRRLEHLCRYVLRPPRISSR